MIFQISARIAVSEGVISKSAIGSYFKSLITEVMTI